MRVPAAPSFVLLLACGGGPATTHPAPAGATAPVAHLTGGGVVSPSAPAPTPSATVDAAPPDDVTRALLSRLRAHHAEDLPSAASLAAQPGAEAALAWIAAHEAHVGVQARAVRLLGAFPNDDARASLLAVVRDPARHVEVRAAAMRALADSPVAARQPLEGDIVAGLEAKDVRLVIAAIRAADGLDSLAGKVAELGRTHPSPLVREAAAARR